MQAEVLLGPAGSGKTFQCLEQARQALQKSATALPLVFLVPKQATYQIERQLLADESIHGYTRLRILSFERLAQWIFELGGQPEPKLLGEEGRVMVLRALLTRHETELKLFRGSARAPGFARELSRQIRELQYNRCSASRLSELAQRPGLNSRLADKLSDLALLTHEFNSWLKKEGLEDADRLVEVATDVLEACPAIQFEEGWLDGFAQLNAQERRLLRALAPRFQKLTLAFCLDTERVEEQWHSHWALVNQSVRELKCELDSVRGIDLKITMIAGGTNSGHPTRFSSPELRHLESCWGAIQPYSEGNASDIEARQPSGVRLIECADPETEGIFAAREILRYVRTGGRFRDTAVLVRQLDQYHDVLRRVFVRYQIPFFLDRREPIAHHPLVELTRGALRTVVFNWRHGDWFSALKSGLVPASEIEIDRLENETLAKGWEGDAWRKSFTTETAGADSMESLRLRIVTPFAKFAQGLGQHPTGEELAEAIQTFYKDLGIEAQLENWSLHSKDAMRIHLTVWEELQKWLETLKLVFRKEKQGLKQWIAVVESGLEDMSAGVVPPVLDQVLLGAVDRSRNPDLQIVFVLGANENVFPAAITSPTVLTEPERSVLEQDGLFLCGSSRDQISLERFLGYIACTRARQRLFTTYALRNSRGDRINPSSLVDHLQRLFPGLTQPETFAAPRRWLDAEHFGEAVAPLLRARQTLMRGSAASIPEPQRAATGNASDVPLPEAVQKLTATEPLNQVLRQLEQVSPGLTDLSPDLAHRLYGKIHDTSVSSLEKFGSCPFWFFVDSGLRARERKRFELDPRQEGTFQHDVLERFHRRLTEQKRTWHDITPAEARDAIGRIADELLPNFADGMLIASAKNRFRALEQKERLQRFVELLVGWMKQYQFEPAEAELKFGFDPDGLPPWTIQVTGESMLALRGSIDRVDLYRPPGSDTALCVIMDYKSSGKKIEHVLLEHGVQLQLPGYLAALLNLDQAKAMLKVSKLQPAGVFFVNLRGEYKSVPNRSAILGDKSAVHKLAFRHAGLFDESVLDYLDSRNAIEGDQFPYKRKMDGAPGEQVKGPMPASEFRQLLADTEKIIHRFGREIYQGKISIDPYQKGRTTPCERCDHAPICRIDPWSHEYRRLRREEVEE